MGSRGKWSGFAGQVEWVRGASGVAFLVTLPFIKARMQPSRPTSTPTTPRRLQGELGEGLAWTWRQPFLRYSCRGREYGSGGRLTALRVRCRNTPTRPVP